jgi:oxygen-independent coproporphyrinogen-3 oxidase
VAKTLALAPDCVTIYQMELPYNTVFSKELTMVGADEPTLAVADWPTKRAWVQYAFDEFVKAGYAISSATTVVKDPKNTRFVYREALWHGADMFGTGVASFGHVNGVHVQNVDTWEAYVEKLDKDELPLGRAYPTTPRDRLIRELVLLLKTGHVDPGYFRTKYGVDILQEFRVAFLELERDGWLTATPASVDCTPDGLMQIDRHLPAFFDPLYRMVRYT